MKPICYSHEEGFNMWDDYRDHLLDKYFSDSLFNCDICSEKFTTIGDFHMHLILHEEKKKVPMQCVFQEVCSTVHSKKAYDSAY